MRTVSMKPWMILILASSVIAISIFFVYNQPKDSEKKYVEKYERNKHNKYNAKNKRNHVHLDLGEITLNKEKKYKIQKPTINRILNKPPLNEIRITPKDGIAINNKLNPKRTSQPKDQILVNDREISKDIIKTKNDQKNRDNNKHLNSSHLEHDLNPRFIHKITKVPTHNVNTKDNLNKKIKQIIKKKKNVETKLINKTKKNNTEQLPKNNNNKKPSFASKIPIYIFEEHQEALHYWFGAVKNKTISSSRNFLIHIDGHSDLSSPIIDKSMPYFRLPKNAKEVASLGPANDVFIVGSIMSNLINNIVFVHPSWDKTGQDSPYQTTNGKSDFNKGILGIGVLTNNASKLCSCITQFEANNSSNKTVCAIQNDDSQSPQEDTVLLRNNLCKIKRTLQGTEILDEVAASKISQVYSKNTNTRNLILDIDEDFFGVELPGVELNKTGADWDKIARVNDASSTIICNLKNRSDETIANNLINGVISDVLHSCVHEKCPISSWIKAINRMRNERKNQYLFCSFGDKENADIAWKEFLEYLTELRLSDLTLLLKEGWCASTPLRFSDEGVPIRLCIGHNTPADYQIPLYTPTLEAIKKRTIQLATLLRRIHQIGAPAIVTLCRSSKDGYTPRHLQQHIEQSILTAFSEISDRYTVYYDKFLWGGKNGWKDRNKFVN